MKSSGSKDPVAWAERKPIREGSEVRFVCVRLVGPGQKSPIRSVLNIRRGRRNISSALEVLLRFSCRASAVVLLLAGWVSITQAEIIVADNFSNVTNSTPAAIGGGAPNVANLPDTTWSPGGNGGGPGEFLVWQQYRGGPNTRSG